ncbi:MAG: type VI secretion system lipoprotein TssJ [Chloroflexi bacterium]|nr:MAG: type VI secretion system lipoprotein TssJ [Chloroflexota bacterium]
MRASPFTTALLCALGLSWSAAGCKSKPGKPVPPVAVVSMRARADANPGPDGRPSPIVLRLYQLKADAAFANSDYFPLFDDEKKVLGQDLKAWHSRSRSRRRRASSGWLAAFATPAKRPGVPSRRRLAARARASTSWRWLRRHA